MNILTVIPARKGSVRFPDKNVRPFVVRNGVPLTLVDMAIDFAMKLPVRMVLLTTDYDRAEFHTAYDLLHSRVPERFMLMERTPALCTSETAMADVVLDALDCYYDISRVEPDAILLLQPTSPIRDKRDVLQALDLFEFKGVKALYSVNPAYEPDGGFYLIDVELFREAKSFFPDGAMPLVHDWKYSIDIDTEQDFRAAQYVYKSLNPR